MMRWCHVHTATCSAANTRGPGRVHGRVTALQEKQSVGTRYCTAQRLATLGAGAPCMIFSRVHMVFRHDV